MKKILFTLCFLSFGLAGFSQSGLGFGQYIFNSQLINPAYFNQRSPVSVNLVGRAQWIDYPGAPNTLGLTGLYNINDHHTVGLTFSNDRLGGFNTFQAGASYAYRINLGRNVQMSFGAKAGYINESAGLDPSSLTNPNDPTFYPRKSISGLTLGAGIYMSGDRFFFGLSAPNLFTNGLMQKSFTSGLAANSFYVTGGYKVVKSKDLMFYPSIMINAVAGAPIHGQLDLNFLVKNGLWLNAGVSTNLGTNIGIGYLFNNGLRIVYDYGFSFAKFNKFGGGIHEITIGYTKDLFSNEFNKRRYITKKGGHFKSYNKQHRRYK